ncbi:hypothetical protein ACQRD6_11620, partial [Prevotella sp. SGI.027]
GSYTGKSQYDVYYCGTNSGAGEKKIVIANNQTQVAFNNTKHFGAAGDCGVAKARKTTVQGKSGYRFDLEHKASYLCLLPYMASKEQRESYKVKSIEITSKDNNIAGTYDLTQTGLSTTGTNESKTITLHVGTDGLLLANQTAETPNIDNSLYVVIAPGTHALKVKFTVVYAKDKTKELTITKKYKSHHFAANKICDIPVNLGIGFGGDHKNADGSDKLQEDKMAFYYSGRNYYMWDARENYWFGHEWGAAEPWQPTTEGGIYLDYSESKAADGDRWYHEGSGHFEASVNPLFKQLPNANEMAWYILKGDPHLEDSTRWEVFGRVQTGGLWLKKLSIIAQENGKESADLKSKDPNGKNLLTSYNTYKVIPKYGKPSDSEISKYFFLPALGFYHRGYFSFFSVCGAYWSSSGIYGDKTFAYRLYFSTDEVYVSSSDTPTEGNVAQPFE